MPDPSHGKCWRCGYPLGADGYEYESLCPGCRTATHVCRNCRFYNTSSINQCDHASADLVSDKQSANHCSYFLPG